MTLYFFSATNDPNWDSLSNWWQDTNHSMQAAGLPTDLDDCILQAQGNCTLTLDDGIFTGNPSVPATIDTTGLQDGGIFTIVANGGYNFQGSVITGDVFLNWNFQQSVAFLSEVIGNVHASGGALVQSCTITGNLYLTQASFTSGNTITGNVYAEDTCSLGPDSQDNITGDVFLTDYATNNSNVTGNGIFRGASINYNGFTGNGDFWDASSNNGSQCFFEGTITFHIRGNQTYPGDPDPINGINYNDMPVALVLSPITPPPQLQPI